MCTHVLHIKIHICVLPLPNLISCDICLVSRLRTGDMVNTATVYTLETSTAQMNLSTSVHYIIKSTDQGFCTLNS